MSDDVDEAFNRSDEEDHDLLTFGEAGLRISEELDELVKRLEEIPEGQGRADLQRRIERLKDARRRVAAAQGDSFFTYEPRN